ncbi:MAG: hypothetical protein QJR02_11830 [Sinobacteraceae bacterium]|nr:hypothetical protein [Nevskiaceae bacterium]
MLTVDVSLETGSASAQLKDSAGASVGQPISLSAAPARISMGDGQTLSIDNGGTGLYRALLVHSGTSDSGRLQVSSEQGAYHLIPAVSARLGNSVIIETDKSITIAPETYSQ